MIEAIIRAEVRAWLARGGAEWTPAMLFDELVRYMTSAPPEQAAELAARLIGFARGFDSKEAPDGRDGNRS